MRWHRINALLIRHLYLYKRSFPRLLDIFYWPLMELLLWGFISLYLERLDWGGLNIVTVLLGAIIMWDLLSQSQRVVSVAFLEEVWERNFLNIFVTPLSVNEFLASTVLLGLVRVVMVAVVMCGIAFLLYAFNIFTFGFSLIPLFANLLLFGWMIGIFTTAIILRYGTAAQVLAFGFLFMVQPFSAVFYPVSALPEAAQVISYLVPSTYVFEGMRMVIAGHEGPWKFFAWGFATNTIYITLVVWYFHRMFAHVKKTGRLLKLDT